jgi:hypothetical protein
MTPPPRSNSRNPARQAAAAGLSRSRRGRTSEPRDSLGRLLEAFQIPIVSRFDCILLWPPGISQPKEPFRPEDPVQYESTQNKIHLDDLCPIYRRRSPRRDTEMAIGRSLVRVWAERITPLLEDREMLMYLGGDAEVTLRFHIVRRGCKNWLDLRDLRFLKKARMQVFRLTGRKLEQIH